MSPRSLVLLAAPTLAALAFACHRPAPPSQDAVIQQPHPGPEHWSQHTRLREIMRRMERGARSYWPQELGDSYSQGTPAERRRGFVRAGELGRELADAAARIPQLVAGAVLPDEERSEFVEMAATLRRRAEQLSAAAAAEDEEALRREFDHIWTTCNACHQRFVGLSGELALR
jgi:hypothetical protein